MRPEAEVEAAHVARVRAEGGESWKFVSPGLAGVPDRLDLRPIPPEHRELVARYVQFTELKAAGALSRTLQRFRIGRLRELGFHVNVKDKL